MPATNSVTRLQILDILKRLGFFYIKEIDNETIFEFHVGHIPSAPFLALKQEKKEGKLLGPYAELVERLVPVVASYIAESDNMIMLPVAVRQAWIADLNSRSQLTNSEFNSVVSNIKL